MPVVLLTRPQASSQGLARQLENLGYQCVIEPLLTIEPVTSRLPDIQNVQAVMITSGNALDARPSLSAPLLSLPCFCVGAKTADKARSAGFQQIFHSAHDGAELAQLIREKMIDKKKSILHIAGRDIDSKAHTALNDAGFVLSPWIVYAALAAKEMSSHTLHLLRGNKLDVVLLFSTRTAETLTRLIGSLRLEACCGSLDAIGFSEVVTAALTSLPWRTLTTASSPTEDAVIARLKDIHPVT